MIFLLSRVLGEMLIATYYPCSDLSWNWWMTTLLLVFSVIRLRMDHPELDEWRIYRQLTSLGLETMVSSRFPLNFPWNWSIEPLNPEFFFTLSGARSVGSQPNLRPGRTSPAWWRKRPWPHYAPGVSPWHHRRRDEFGDHWSARALRRVAWHAITGAVKCHGTLQKVYRKMWQHISYIYMFTIYVVNIYCKHICANIVSSHKKFQPQFWLSDRQRQGRQGHLDTPGLASCLLHSWCVNSARVLWPLVEIDGTIFKWMAYNGGLTLD